MATTATSELFLWSGTDKNGRQTKGEINAASQAMARAQLRQRGINPRSVRRKPKPLLGARKKPIKPPTRLSINASVRNCQRMSLGVAPTD